VPAPNGRRLKLRPAGAADKIENLHWAFRRRRRPQADSFKRALGFGIDETHDGRSRLVTPSLAGSPNRSDDNSKSRSWRASRRQKRQSGCELRERMAGALTGFLCTGNLRRSKERSADA